MTILRGRRRFSRRCRRWRARRCTTPGVVECKAQICKLALGYTDPAVFDAFVSELTMAFKHGPAVSVYLDAPAAASGYSTVDVYLVRE